MSAKPVCCDIRGCAGTAVVHLRPEGCERLDFCKEHAAGLNLTPDVALVPYPDNPEGPGLRQGWAPT